MPHDHSVQEQVLKLSREELYRELERRALPTAGILHTCRLRLIKELKRERDVAAMSAPGESQSLPVIQVTQAVDTAESQEPALPASDRRTSLPVTAERAVETSEPQGNTDLPTPGVSEARPLSTASSRRDSIPRTYPPEATTANPGTVTRQVRFAERVGESQTSPSPDAYLGSLCRDLEEMRCGECARRYRRYPDPHDPDEYERGQGYYPEDRRPRDHEIASGYERPVNLPTANSCYRDIPRSWNRDDVTASRRDIPRGNEARRAHAYSATERPHVTPRPPPRDLRRERSYYEAHDRTYAPREGPNYRYERNPASFAYDIMRRWNLSFSGRTGEDGNAFLTRIQEGRRLVNIADGDLLCCLPFFLSGIALYWFRSQQYSWFTWEDFEYAFRSRFIDPDFQQTLREELSRRTQGESETVADYMTCVRAMAERMIPPMDERELIALIHRNMAPRLQVVIPRETIYSFGQLAAVATRIERSYILSRSFRPPPLPEHSLLPDLAYHGPRSKTPKNMVCTLGADAIESELYAIPNQAATSDAKKAVKKSGKSPKNAATNSAPSPTAPPVEPNTATAVNNQTNPFLTPESAPPTTAANIPPPASPRTPRPLARCWNCYETGHTYRFCTKPMNIFCYGCGKRDVTRPNCSKCSGNAGGGD